MNDIKNDINLKEAVSRREQQLPPMPEGLNEKVMGSLEEYDCLKKKTPLHRGRGWRWVFLAAACVAGFVVIFLAPPKSAEKQPPVVIEEPTFNFQLSTFNFQLDDGQTPLEAQLAHQQEIKKKGERLAAYIQEQTKPKYDY
jgi:anti-sigma-K factor RskA